MDGKADHDEHGDTQTHFRFPQASSDFAGRNDDTDVSSATPVDSADDSTVGRHGHDYTPEYSPDHTPEHEFPTWGESWGDTSPATGDVGRPFFRRRGSGRTDQSPAHRPEADPSRSDPSHTDASRSDPGRRDLGYPDASPAGYDATDFGWAADSSRSPSHDDHGRSDSPRNDLSRGDFGQTDVGLAGGFSSADVGGTDFGGTGFGGTDSGRTDPGRGDYGSADQGRADRGIADYGRADYGQADYGRADRGIADYGRADYGQANYGSADYGQADYGQADYGRADHGSADYGSADYGSADFGSADYGSADYGRTDAGGSDFGRASGAPTSSAGIDDQAGGYRPGGYPLGGYGPDYTSNPYSWSPSVEEPPARTPSKALAPTRTSRRAERDDDTQERPNWRRRAALARKNMPLWQELPLLLVVAFCLAVLIRTFLLQAFFIPSSSMEQTLLVGDRVLVNKIVYDVRQPERGEVVVFKGTDSWAPENFEESSGGALARIGRTMGDLVGVSRPGEKDFIKRVIGVSGDRVSCCDNAGRVYVNGRGIDEPYVTTNSPLEVPPDARVCRSRRFGEVLVPPGQLFVMGDHRIVSQDSRCQGTVPIENVIGRAFVIVWPSGRWDTLSVPETFQNVPGPVALGPSGQQRIAHQDPSDAAGLGGAAIVLPVLVSLVVFGRSGRKPLWGRRTLRR